MSATLIEHGLLIDPSQGREGEYDILIEEGVIRDVAKPGTFKAVPAVERIDAAGKWVVPGLIDVHAHLREPGYEWKETILTGTRAAVAGGFTTVCCMANTNPVNDNAEVTKFILDKAASAAQARVCPIGAVTVGLKGEQMAPFSELRKAGCVGFSDDGKPISNMLLLRRALEWCAMLEAPIALHEEDDCLCESGSMNESALSSRLGLRGMPGAAESLCIARDIEIAAVTGAHIHFCHVSTARSVNLIRRAKEDGLNVTAEVTPHHLLLNEDAVLEFDTNAKMSPPLRSAADVEAVREGLRDGTIDCIATDHAPHELDKKRVEFSLAAFGIIGFQTALPLVLDLVRGGTLSRMRAIESLTSAPARIMGLPAGSLQPGIRADITVIDPSRQWHFTKENNLSLSANSPFFGRPLRGCASSVLVDGRLAYSGSEQLAAA